jgi:hypothetical protein
MDIAAARALLPRVIVPDRITEGLCQTALALGIASVRPAVMALRAARAAAALAWPRRPSPMTTPASPPPSCWRRARCHFPVSEEQEPEAASAAGLADSTPKAMKRAPHRRSSPTCCSKP